MIEARPAPSDLQRAPALARHPGAAVAVGVLIAVVGCVIAWRIGHGLYLPSSDDHARLTFSREWGRSHVLSHGSTYWLPLPSILNGVVSGFAGSTDPWLQTLPSILGLVLAVVFLGLPSRDRPDLFNPLTAAVFLSYPVQFRLGPSQLSETLFAASVALAARAFFSFEARPGRCRGLALLIALNPMIWIRYEGWLFAGALWLWAWGAYSWKKRHGPAQRERPHALFVLGTIQLLIFPAIWMTLNQLRNGHFLAFLGVVEISNTSGPPMTRLQWFLDWGFFSSPAATVLGLAGLAVCIRRLDWRPIALALILAFPFTLTVVQDNIGTVYHERFALGLHIGLAMFAGTVWASTWGRSGWRKRASTFYVPAAAAAGLLLSSLRTTVWDESTGPMRVRTVAEQVRDSLEPGDRILMIFKPWFGAAHDDGAIFVGAFPRDRVIHAHFVEDERPFTLDYLRRWNFGAILYRRESALQDVAAPLGPEIRFDLDWRMRKILYPEDASPQDE